jgi:uncharacterized protein YgiM (DUF1202 family)
MKSLSVVRVGLATAAIVVAATLPSWAQPGRIVAPSNQEINVRYQPSTRSEVVAYTYNGERVEILGSHISEEDGYGWYRVEFANRARGWVRADLVKLSIGTVPQNPPSGSDTDTGYMTYLNAGSTGQKVSLRRAPGLDAAVIFAGRHGDRVRVDDSFKGRDGIWVRVTYPNALPNVTSTGWVRRELITK